MDICGELIEREWEVWSNKPTNKHREQGQVAPSRRDKIRRRYSMSTVEVPIMGRNDLDEHRTGFRDPDHLFLMGLFKSFHNFIFFGHLNVQSRLVFIARATAFPWPPRCTKLSISWTTDGGKKYGNDVSMTTYRQLTFVGLTAYRDIVSPEILRLYVDTWNLFNRLRSSCITLEMVQILQDDGSDIIRRGQLLGTTPHIHRHAYMRTHAYIRTTYAPTRTQRTRLCPVYI